MKAIVYDYEQRGCDENGLLGQIIEISDSSGDTYSTTEEEIIYKENCYPVQEDVEPSDEALQVLAKTLTFCDIIKSYVVESIAKTGEADINDAVQCAMEKFLNGFK